MTNFNAHALRHVVNLLDLGDRVPASDAELLKDMSGVLGTIAGEIANLQDIIRRQALANLTITAEAAGAKLKQQPAPQVPCPVCGGEALGHLDALRRVYFIPASLVTPAGTTSTQGEKEQQPCQ